MLWARVLLDTSSHRLETMCRKQHMCQQCWGREVAKNDAIRLMPQTQAAHMPVYAHEERTHCGERCWQSEGAIQANDENSGSQAYSA
jgi:hypothetical protein